MPRAWHDAFPHYDTEPLMYVNGCAIATGDRLFLILDSGHKHAPSDRFQPARARTPRKAISYQEL